MYLDEMKKTLPEYGIGLDIFGRPLIDLFDQPNTPKCKYAFIIL